MVVAEVLVLEALGVEALLEALTLVVSVEETPVVEVPVPTGDHEHE